MQSLYIALGVLLLVGVWGFYESGRRFRAEFKRRGMSWQKLCAQMAAGEGEAGILVVDTVWGPQRGLGHPVVWWLPAAVEDFAGPIEGGAAHLVRCPRGMRNLEALRQRFGEHRVAAHGWALGRELLEARDER